MHTPSSRRGSQSPPSKLVLAAVLVPALVAAPPIFPAAAPVVAHAHEIGPAGPTPGTTAGSPSQDAAELTDRAVQLIEDDSYEEALDLLAQAVEADASSWRAHYQRGRVLGLMGRMEQARDALLEAVALNPGFAHGHALAATAARQIEDWDTAWDQGVKAYLAGADQAQAFGNIGNHSTPPDDIEERLAAWKVYVAGIDISELQARAERPENQRGGASASGQQQANLATTELALLERQLRQVVSDATGFGLVPEAGQAAYALVISVDDLRDRQPMRMEGYLRLYRLDGEEDEPVYYRPIELRDISATGALYNELQRYVQQMGTWKDEQDAGG